MGLKMGSDLSRFRITLGLLTEITRERERREDAMLVSRDEHDTFFNQHDRGSGRLWYLRASPPAPTACHCCSGFFPLVKGPFP